MKIYKVLNISGALLDKNQLERYLEKVATNHNLTLKSDKQTYPVPRMLENYEVIKQVYNLLNEHLKLGINIHPAGEWLLDNFYIIEETIKSIQKELTLKKYTNFLGLQNGYNKGFARVYVLAAEIVAYTDSKIQREDLEKYLEAYQTKKTLSMDEIWNIGIFLEIAIIEKVREICEKIYVSQMQKYKVENIVERLVDRKDKNELVFKTKGILKNNNNIFKDMKYPFIEYMSYVLKRYGKKANSYLKVLEEEVEKTGTSVSEVIKKEHFDIAVRKVSIGNCITSLKTIQRINFLEIFEKINGVEEVLKQDPANVYDKMDYKTKEYYRNKIKEISKKTKISEIYIAKKILELANKCDTEKKRHTGYYLIDKGVYELYIELNYKNIKKLDEKKKAKIYVLLIYFISIIVSCMIAKCIPVNSFLIFILTTILLLIPISELIVQLAQYILNKIVKPKLIPKLDFSNGIDEENSTMVIIPTILNSKEKVKELINKLEVFYLANKSENLYFALLGDCSQSDKEIETFDEEVINEGIKQSSILNKKYGKEIFYFFYRNRIWNDKESSYLGWERKRGLINQFNEFILGNLKDVFRVNTMTKIPKIKYVITLDSDTDLILNSAFELVGAMAHILNKPVIDNDKNIVIEGYGLIQPRIGVNLDVSYKNLFTKIFAGVGGIDSYTNAISDTYQDNFGEGIFTGKGIYDLKVFSKVLSKAFPENTVLSHDLLEGSYLRCGLATDILLMDGYPTKYISFMNRLSRWIRGDWQINNWLKNNIENSKEKIKNPLNFLSKYKIFDNLRRSLFEISTFIGIIYLVIIEKIYSLKLWPLISFLFVILIFPFALEIANIIIFKREGEQKQKAFVPTINGLKGSIIRAILTIGCFPYKVYVSFFAIIKTLYRKYISHKNMLEWMTSEEAEKQSKTDLISYYKTMFFNCLLGIITLIYAVCINSICGILLSAIWLLTPLLMCSISKEKKEKLKLDEVSDENKKYIYEIGNKTWQFFKDNLNEKNNYLIPDNYQENRKPLIVNRTSSTNIGLSLIAVISSYDLGYSNLEETIKLLDNMLKTIDSLPKWNGHLYNWYNTKTKEPLVPRYISTVDSGNFVGYLYVTKQFLLKVKEFNFTIKNIRLLNKNIKYKSKKINLYKANLKLKDINRINVLLDIVDRIINQTDFKLLYSNKQRLFSIGFNIEENKLTDSYYDLLASEARQASLIAIAKKDVPAKHWNNLSRTLTILGKYKGLISWSGTAFEYLMPNVNIPKYEGSLLDESSKFLIMSQKEYCRKLGIPWGISESAFNLKDLHSNYQYKAFGIPWLGLKRGLADEMVVASYGSILALNEVPNEVIANLKKLEKLEMYNKYGFYESIDFTPSRLSKGEKACPVKTYMAHHQGLILLSINNLLNNNILQKRFMKNPEIQAVSILLQERMPETSIITKENKEKIEKLKYQDYENYSVQVFNKIDEKITRGNVISNEDYTIALNQKGIGFSKWKDIYINRYKKTDDYAQGIFSYVKNIKTKRIWSSNYNEYTDKPDKYIVKFMPDQDEIERVDGNIKSTIKITTSPNDPVEIRRLELKNLGNEEEILEVSSYFEPVLSNKEQDYAHPAFNNLFLNFEYDDYTNNLIIKRSKRAKDDKEIYLGVQMFTEGEVIGESEYEIDKEKFIGRGNLGIPKMIKQSIPFSKKGGLVTDPIVAMKKTIKINPEETVYIDLILSINNEKGKAIYNLEKYRNGQKIKMTFDLSRAKVEEENRYLQVKGKDIEIYQKILSYIIFENPLKKQNIEKLPKLEYKQEDLWKYGISGDLPIVLVKIRDANDIYVIKQIIKAYEFFRTKNIQVELVILDEEKHSYENYVQEEIETVILNNHMSYLKNIKGGIFVLSKNQMEDKDVKLLELLSVINIDSHLGNLQNIVKDLEEEYFQKYKDINEEKAVELIDAKDKTEDIDVLNNVENLKYYNEYGAFSNDGKEYLIRINKDNRLPTVWSHIMANEKIGTIVTENMGGYTWDKNSRLNRITAWNNNPCMDIPSEVIYLKDTKTSKSWSIGCNPKPDENNYNVIYGFGYAKYIHTSSGIVQELETFIPKEDPVKINILTLKNTTPNKKKIKLVYYIKPVIGEEELKSDEYIDLNYENSSNILCAKKIYNNEFNNFIFISSSEEIKSYTGDKKFFLGNGGLENPDGLKKVSLDNNSSKGKSTCIAIELEVEIESFSNKNVSIILGTEHESINAKDLAYKYSKINNCNLELERVKKYWKELLGRLNVETPIESTNILLNGWLMYQTITSRLVGRSGFYQSGGAFGFRDQLQDTFGVKYLDPNILKNQIIKHSKHQFIEGDVEHWWHEETNKGIRTRFSDDLLWLPYAVLEYINFTGDKSILDIETNYISGNLLDSDVVEKYDIYMPSNIKESIYKHCIRAINKSLNFGENGLPKIGSGDWNDGFSEVGNKGKGESIWLGFFLYYILEGFIDICLEKKDHENSDKYFKIKVNLRKALNTNGWDGRWFKRAYMDDGNVLGSMENEECRIDSIAQSWGIISNAADNDKKYISMESLENHLVDKENGIIKLLDPPFEKSKLEPGYIKAYLPGVRENGGQYTHECCC